MSSAKELYGTEIDSDVDWFPAAAESPARGVDEGASFSGSYAVGTSSGSTAPAGTLKTAPFELEDGRYVFANESGRGVCIGHRRRVVNTAWAVQVLRDDDDGRTARVLRSAYGRYLSATRSPARSGHIGGYVAQRVLESSDDHHIEWSTAVGKRGSIVLIRATDGGPRALRANGRYRRWNKGVSFGPVGRGLKQH